MGFLDGVAWGASFADVNALAGDSNGVCFGEWEDVRVNLDGLPNPGGARGGAEERVDDDDQAVVLFELATAGILFWN